VIKYYVGAAVMAATFFFGWNFGSDRVQKKWDKREAAIVAAHLDYEKTLREKELAWRSKYDNLQKAQEKEDEVHKNNIAIISDNANGLHEQYKAALRKLTACKGAGAASRGKATDTAGDMLADLFKRVESDARIIAEFADRSRRSGLMCQAAHEVIK
jgi:hypothetical protein